MSFEDIKDEIYYIEPVFLITENGSEKEVTQIEFIQRILSSLRTIASHSPLNVTTKYGTIVLRQQPQSQINELRKVIKEYIDLNYETYNAEIDDTGLFVSCQSSLEDINDTILNAEVIIESEDNAPTQTRTKPEVDDVEDLTPSFITLSNKAYTAFVKTCEAVDNWLEEYPEIAIKFPFSLTKSDRNLVAKALIAPIQCWDKLAPVVKMDKDDYEALKRNLIQLSKDNACVALSSSSSDLYHWDEVFEKLQSYKLNNTKMRLTKNGFISKTKAEIIDKKTKQKLGVATLVLSIYIEEALEEYIGNLKKLNSSISYDLIVR